MNELVTINSRENKVTIIAEGRVAEEVEARVRRDIHAVVVVTVEKFTVKESLSGDAQWYCDCNVKPPGTAIRKRCVSGTR